MAGMTPLQHYVSEMDVYYNILEGREESQVDLEAKTRVKDQAAFAMLDYLQITVLERDDVIAVRTLRDQYHWTGSIRINIYATQEDRDFITQYAEEHNIQIDAVRIDDEVVVAAPQPPEN